MILYPGFNAGGTNMTNHNHKGDKNPMYRHGGAKSRLYNIWNNMKQRCRNPKVPCYKHYGGKGVSVCAEWDIFSVFSDWALSHGYTDDLTIERTSNTGDYCPSNCTWATCTQQAHNRKQHTSASGYRGVWKESSGRFRAQIKHKGVLKYIGTYDTAFEAAIDRDEYIVAKQLPHKLMGEL